MPLPWKALGRTLEIITIVLLVVAVRYLWVKADSKTTESPEIPQIEIPAPMANTETFETPYQPQVPTPAESGLYQPPVPASADTETYQQPAESTPPVYLPDILLSVAPHSLCSSPATPIDHTDTIADSPNAVIEEFFALLDKSLEGRRDELAKDQQAFFALINGILLPRHDRRYTAQLVLARHWRTASDEERDRFTSAFYCRTIQKIAEPLLTFEREQLRVLAFRGDTTRKRTTVKTMVRLDDGTQVTVNYGMVKRDSGWKMFDVTIEGISYLRNFKAELNAEIQARGLRGVIARLEAGTSTANEE